VPSVIIVTFSNREGCGGYGSPGTDVVEVSVNRVDIEGGGVEVSNEREDRTEVSRLVEIAK
jgi:hypothetical protein